MIDNTSRRLADEFIPFLLNYGYVKKRGGITFIKNTDSGFSKIVFNYSRTGGVLTVGIAIGVPRIASVGLKIRNTSENDVMHLDKYTLNCIYGISLNAYKNAYTIPYNLYHETHFQSAIIDIRNGLEQFGLPLLKQHQSEETILPLLLGKIELKDKQSQYHPHNMFNAIIICANRGELNIISEIDKIAHNFLDTYKRAPIERYTQYLDYRQKALNYFGITDMPEPPVAQAV